jgi:hypothetical protein
MGILREFLTGLLRAWQLIDIKVHRNMEDNMEGKYVAFSEKYGHLTCCLTWCAIPDILTVSHF